MLGTKGSTVPDQWPSNVSTQFNVDTPMNVSLNNDTFQIYMSVSLHSSNSLTYCILNACFQSSPPPFSPKGRTNDIDAIISVIQKAEKFVYISVMDYTPLTIYTPKLKFWPVIDDTLKTAAIEHKVKVKMLISWWNHSRPAEDKFLKSLAVISGSYPRVSFEIVSTYKLNNYTALSEKVTFFNV